jgi:hypothetical protein
MIRVVLDTNISVSALPQPPGVPAQGKAPPQLGRQARDRVARGHQRHAPLRHGIDDLECRKRSLEAPTSELSMAGRSNEMVGMPAALPVALATALLGWRRQAFYTLNLRHRAKSRTRASRRQQRRGQGPAQIRVASDFVPNLYSWTSGFGCKPLKGLAPRPGLEPGTLRLTAECSTIELPRNLAS